MDTFSFYGKKCSLSWHREHAFSFFRFSICTLLCSTQLSFWGSDCQVCSWTLTTPGQLWACTLPLLISSHWYLNESTLCHWKHNLPFFSQGLYLLSGFFLTIHFFFLNLCFSYQERKPRLSSGSIVLSSQFDNSCENGFLIPFSFLLFSRWHNRAATDGCNSLLSKAEADKSHLPKLLRNYMIV